ncbi:MAG: hypothetical protein AB2826_27315 [Candidatus Thiodiazotropha sp.]
MSYTLQAIILEKPDPLMVEVFGLKIIEMPCQLFLVPLIYDYVESNSIPFLPLTDEGLDNISGYLLEICLSLSLKGKAAYVEAEFFGGEGTQGCALFENGKVKETAQENRSAINHALSWLGISPEGEQDEFTVAGLGMHRNTEGWLDA